MIRFLVIALVCLQSVALCAQDLSIQENGLQWRYEHLLAKKSNDLHSAVKPYFQSELESIGAFDSIHPMLLINQLDSIGPDSRYIRPQLLFDLSGGVDAMDTTDSPLKSRLGIGVAINSRITEKLHLNFAYIYNRHQTPDYIRELANSRYMLPGDGFVKTDKKTLQTHSFSGYASYTPDKHFNFQLGQGRHFFGDGHRSLFLSDNNYAYPYLKVTSTFWRFRYVNLYSMQRNIAESGGERSGFQTKFSTTHFLSYNVNDMLNLNFFETVIWHARDNNLNRGYDLSYLNPIMLYRPAEFNAGSADNALLGMGFKIKMSDEYQLYGQLLLDEFLYAHIKEDWKQFVNKEEELKSGWWANKYAFQIGLKGFDLFGFEGLSVQTEFNTVRPFTYSHGTLTQNYAHNGQPLAHPLGSNFYEWVNIVRYQHNDILFEAQFNHIIHGDSPSSVNNYGGDIFIPYGNRAREFENFTGQGIQKRTLFGRLKASKIIEERSNLQAEVGIDYRRSATDFDVKNTAYIYIGLRSAIFNRTTDY